jgi:hypothetical protein
LSEALRTPREHSAPDSARVVARYDRATSGDRILELYETLLA